MTPDPRAQAEQRLAEKMAKRIDTVEDHYFCAEICAKLAAEEIEKMVLAAWKQPAVEVTNEGYTPGGTPFTSYKTLQREIRWHRVCADAEKGEKP